jgi:hypothetical protein
VADIGRGTRVAARWGQGQTSRKITSRPGCYRSLRRAAEFSRSAAGETVNAAPPWVRSAFSGDLRSSFGRRKVKASRAPRQWEYLHEQCCSDARDSDAIAAAGPATRRALEASGRIRRSWRLRRLWGANYVGPGIICRGLHAGSHSRDPQIPSRLLRNMGA